MIGIKSVRSPYIIRKLSWKELKWEVHDAGKRIFLTFDDGPIPEVTPQVLEILKEHRAKACFFCVGDNAAKNPEILERILENGHSVGNHTYSHLNGWKTDSAEYIQDVHKAAGYLNTKVFRPPHGRIRRDQALQISLNYEIVLWSVLSWDFDQRISPEKCLENVLSHTKSGSIVVFHDSIKASRNMLFALPRFLKHFSDKGFTFEALSDQHFK